MGACEATRAEAEGDLSREAAAAARVIRGARVRALGATSRDGATSSRGLSLMPLRRRKAVEEQEVEAVEEEVGAGGAIALGNGVEVWKLLVKSSKKREEEKKKLENL